MHLVILDPSSGETLDARPLTDDELLDLPAFADAYGLVVGMDVSHDEGHVLNCCGDFRIELRPDPDNAGVIWAGQSFYFEAE